MASETFSSPFQWLLHCLSLPVICAMVSCCPLRSKRFPTDQQSQRPRSHIPLSMVTSSAPLNSYKYCVDSMVILTNPPPLEYSQPHPLFISSSPSMTEGTKVLPSPTIPANRRSGPRSHAMSDHCSPKSEYRHRRCESGRCRGFNPLLSGAFTCFGYSDLDFDVNHGSLGV